MPQYKVTYFEKGERAELTRLALCAAKQTFEDVRLKSEEWAEMKKSSPQGLLPLLEVDGKVICQSGAMVRYVAREHDLYGEGNMENTAVDVVLETGEDLITKLIKIHYEQDENKKSEAFKDFTDNVIPKFVTILCKILCGNGGQGWLVGSKLTIADLGVFNIFDGIQSFYGPDSIKALTENKKLKAHYDRVSEVTEIKEWLVKRPKKLYNC